MVKDNTILITNKNETTVVSGENSPGDVQGLLKEGSVKQFTYDRVFESNSSQEDLFKEIGVKVISQVLEGINSTVLAYGVTGSGKTHTIQGYHFSFGEMAKKDAHFS